MLHKVISGERSAESINFINDDLLKSPQIEWIKGKTVTRLDSASKTVYAGEEALVQETLVQEALAQETLVSGDTILIATGANSVTPPIGDLKTAKNAFGLRHLADARSIVESAKNAKKIAVIGAGLVGLDAVYGILESANAGSKAPEITVIEMAPTILAINIDAHAAEAYQKRFEQRGVKFMLASKVINTKSSQGNITAIELEGGTLVPCDMVIVAVGVRPAVAFLEGSGVELTERKAVKTDDFLAANIPGIFAAGDAAGLSGIWPNAQKQGEMAAYNMTGTKWAYDDRYSLKNTINFFSLPCLSLGEINPREGDQCLIREDRGNYKKLIIRNGIPVGIILQGEIGGSGFWLQLIKNKIPVTNLGKSPWKISYADFYGIESTGEYKFVV
jgi:NAD(P)H-nitrite reductase large subunit